MGVVLKVLKVVPKMLRGCVEGALRLCRRWCRCLEVMLMAVNVVPKVLRGCAEGDGRCSEGAWGLY